MANFSLPILVYINHNQHLSFVLKYKTEGNEKTENYWNIASCKLYLEGIRDLLNGGNYSYTHSYFTKKTDDYLMFYEFTIDKNTVYAYYYKVN